MNFAPSLDARGETLLILSAGTPDPTREQMAAGLHVGSTDGTPLTDPPCASDYLAVHSAFCIPNRLPVPSGTTENSKRLDDILFPSGL